MKKFMLQNMLARKWAVRTTKRREEGMPLMSARGGLNKQLVGDIEIPYTTKQEQERIGSFFASLDHLITLHKRKGEELKNMKKWMLEKVFV